MSNHGTAVAALDAAIELLANIRDEMQAQHDETIAAIASPEPARSEPSTFFRLLCRW